jgi:hypothetical protein
MSNKDDLVTICAGVTFLIILVGIGVCIGGLIF